MQKLRKYIVNKAFTDYLPNVSDFVIVDEPIPPLKNGEFLVKTEYLSVDPYMRSFAENYDVPYDQFGFQVGKVIESKNNNYPINSYVVSHSGWKDFVILDGSADEMFGLKPYKPNTDGFPLYYALGYLGMPGMTAYLGFKNICQPQKGDVVCISSAAGVVGSLVGQIAKIYGCTVIGFAGTDEKVKFLMDELHFHHAFNYKSADINACLKTVAPNGVDCYFDNVGGSLSEHIIANMKQNGRVAICGAISTYGKRSKQKSLNAPTTLKIESFGFTQWDWDEQSAALSIIRNWLICKNVITKETIYHGFNNMPKSLISMLSGNNIGKAVVKIL